jgi:beta-aspartyl-dipeptidase (metallo-type)
MFTLLTGAEVYAPEPLGTVDLLLLDDRIAAVGRDMASSVRASGLEVATMDLTGLTLTPGLIDGHFHPLGGGDYEGPLARTTDIELGELIRNGITTGVGVLGSDCDARTCRTS